MYTYFTIVSAKTKHQLKKCLEVVLKSCSTVCCAQRMWQFTTQLVYTQKNSKKNLFLGQPNNSCQSSTKVILSFHLTTYIHHCTKWFYFLFLLHWPRFTAMSFNSYNFSHNNFPLTKRKVYIAASVNVTRVILQIISHKFNSNWCFWFSFNKPPLCSYSRLHHIRSGKPSALAGAQFYEPNALPFDQLAASKHWKETHLKLI